MFWKKMQVKKRPLDICCTKDQQIEMYRELYAKAAKERDEANARVRQLEEENKQLRTKWVQALNYVITEVPPELVTLVTKSPTKLREEIGL